jgi:hypothetical protein
MFSREKNTSVTYSPDGGRIIELRGAFHPVVVDDERVEGVRFLEESVFAVGFVPRSALGEETDDYEDVWGSTKRKRGKVPPPGPSEVDLRAGRHLYTAEGKLLGQTQDAVRLRRGSAPHFVVVPTAWGNVELSLKK